MITEINEGMIFGVCVCTSIGRDLTVGRHYLTTIDDDDAYIILFDDDNTWQYPYEDEIKMVGRLKITKVK